jgi:hypothetical protein
MNTLFAPDRAVARAPRRSIFVFFFAGAFCALLLLSRVAAQTVVVTIDNASFESPPPSVFPDYTVGASGWTRLRTDIDSGTFAPGVSGVTPAPIDGSQVGYANGAGGLLQVLSTTFVANTTYNFSAYIGYRSDGGENGPNGLGSVQIGYYSGGTFHALGSQSGTPGLGEFDFVTGTYVAGIADQGLNIAIFLSNPGSVQVLFDQVSLTATAIPEPATTVILFGGAALGAAFIRRRHRTVQVRG